MLNASLFCDALSEDKIAERSRANELRHKKDNAKISNTAAFQSCKPNTHEMADIG